MKQLSEKPIGGERDQIVAESPSSSFPRSAHAEKPEKKATLGLKTSRKARSRVSYVSTPKLNHFDCYSVSKYYVAFCLLPTWLFNLWSLFLANAFVRPWFFSCGSSLLDVMETVMRLMMRWKKCLRAKKKMSTPRPKLEYGKIRELWPASFFEGED